MRAMPETVAASREAGRERLALVSASDRMRPHVPSSGGFGTTVPRST